MTHLMEQQKEEGRQGTGRKREERREEEKLHTE